MTQEESVNPNPPAQVEVGEIVETDQMTEQRVAAERADAFAGHIGRNWGVLLSMGIVLAGFGVAVMVWPQATVGIIAVLLGLALLISGLFSIVGSITRPDRPTAARVLMGISGVLSMILGAVALSGIVDAIWILALMVGFGWIVGGITDLVVGISGKGLPGRGLSIASGILGIIAGTIVLVWPEITLLVLAWVGGLLLVVLGIVQVVMAIRLRKVTDAYDLERVVA